MKGDREQVLTLIAEIENELDNLSVLNKAIIEVTDQLEKVSGKNKIYLVESAALKLHNLYSLVERIFEKLATEINGGFSESPDWHMRLLRSMTLDVKGVRPPVIDEETYRILLEYLKFRHVVRSIYGFELDPERITPLLKNAPQAVSKITENLKEFIKFLKSLAE